MTRMPKSLLPAFLPRLLAPLLPGLLLAGGALAQDIVLPEPVTAPEPGQAAPAPAPAARIDAAPAIRDAAPAAAAAAPPLARLAPLLALPDEVVMGASLPRPGILRLTGEVAGIMLALELPADQPVPQGLQLALRSAINVLPDSAAIEVAVNDAPPVALPLHSFDGFQLAELPTPALVAGSNRIRLAVRQPHRVFCGPEASFGVWTELDLTRSGALMSQGVAAASAQGFAQALSQQIGSGAALTVRVAPGVDPAAMRQLALVLGAAMQGRGWIDFASPYDMGPRPAVSVLLAPAVDAQTPSVAYRRDATGAPVMVVAARGAELPGLAEGLQAVALPPAPPLPLLHPGKARTLAELGQGDIIGNTRYFQQDVGFRLPDDWLLLANQKARLQLHYGHAENLPAGANLLVKVNGQTVRLLPLDRDGGRLLPPLDIGFAARLLHSGANRLSFEMMVPGNPPDMACPPRQFDMLVVAQDSALTVPVSPAMQLSGLASVLAWLDPAGVTPDPKATEPQRIDRAAAQLAAAMPPPEGANPAVSLLVTDFSTLPASLADVSLRALQGALFAQTPPADAGVAAPAPQFDLGAGDAPAATAPAKDRAWSPLAWAARSRDRILASAFLASDQDLSDWLQGRRGDALLIAAETERPQALQLILGPQADPRGISRTLDGLQSSRQGNGAAALLSNDGSWQVWAPVVPPRLQEPVTLANLFPILGNYASWSPLLFAGALLGLGLLSVVPALIVVIVFRKWRLR
ncbi:hypothetical protein GL279_05255 [Paracoccus limosus]|uniref:Cyclic di-GMP-binding protein n=1 Tax=Paracoccus limosus TaxID=913252 RepID=A0A844H369_9RHOB|nr:cellulose biosynthesis cyclic di-GMP-binding regulatory protein BcsB [Paracoccus limosus]MTH34004.1 hypothetical protein [Paracoccus limosus]